MEDIRKDLELVEVNYEDDSKAIMSFLDAEKGEIFDITFNRKEYSKEQNKFVKSEEKEEKVDTWCEEQFNTTFDKLGECVGVKKDVYVYDMFASLWQVVQTKRFEDKDVGKIISTKISEIVIDDIAIRIRYEINDETYESKMTTAKYVEGLEKWFVDPTLKTKQYKKFEKKFKVPVERKEELIGREIFVEVKKAFGKFTYGDIKALD